MSWASYKRLNAFNLCRLSCVKMWFICTQSRILFAFVRKKNRTKSFLLSPIKVFSSGIIRIVRAQIFRKTNISYPLIRRRKYMYQEVRNVRLRKFCVRTKWIISSMFKGFQNCIFILKTRNSSTTVSTWKGEF